MRYLLMLLAVLTLTACMSMGKKVDQDIPFVGMFVGGAETENTSVVLSFDRSSVLTSYTSTEGGSSLGTGISSGAKQ
jgi:hypothetical protein